jgi:phosphoserine phosphatase
MDEIKKERVVVVDICNTLFDSNTTFDFIDYCVRTKRIKRGVLFYHWGVKRLSPFFWFLLILHKAFRHDYHKSLAVSLLAHQSIEDVSSWASQFYREFLALRSIHQTADVLKSFDSKQVILASSTIEPVAKVIAFEMGIENFVSTELEVSEGRYTGRIKNELSGNKLEAIQKKLGNADFMIDVVLTDNFSDRELMIGSLRKYAVCYNKRQVAFWSEIPGVKILTVDK